MNHKHYRAVLILPFKNWRDKYHLAKEKPSYIWYTSKCSVINLFFLKTKKTEQTLVERQQKSHIRHPRLLKFWWNEATGEQQ